MVAELDAAQVHHAVHHRHFHVLPSPVAVALVQRGQQPIASAAGSGIADLRAGHERRASGTPVVLIAPPSPAPRSRRP